jgi:hypothetical protein
MEITLANMEAWALGVAIVGVLIGAGAAYFAYIAARAATISIRRPALQVADMSIFDAQSAPFVGEIRAEQERYEGPAPDYRFVITLRNNGEVPALRVGGSFRMMGGALKPINYPGYTDVRIVFVPHGPDYEVTIPISDEHRAPPDPTPDPLTFWIPMKLFDEAANVSKEELSRTEMHVAYRFSPENGDSIEDMWFVRIKGYPSGPSYPDYAGPLREADRTINPQEGLLRERPAFWRRLFGG